MKARIRALGVLLFLFLTIPGFGASPSGGGGPLPMGGPGIPRPALGGYELIR